MTTQTKMPNRKALVIFGALLVALFAAGAIFSSGDSYEDRRGDAVLECVDYITDPVEHEACIDYEMGR